MGKKKVTITQEEYDELLAIKEFATEVESINHKTGKAYDHYAYLKGLNEYLKNNLIGYGVKEREYKAILKRKEHRYA